MKQLFREYFTYTRGERNGVLALLSVIALLLVFLAFSPFFIPRREADFTAFEKEVDALRAKVETATPSKEPVAKAHDNTSTIVEHFLFDPNTATADDLERLGLSSRQAKAVVTYVSKGGKFRSKEDFKKLRVIPPALYTALESYISIAPGESPSGKIPVTVAPAVIEVNTADSLALIDIDGIGPVFASRIMKFRKALGGFVSREQLKEVRGMTDETYALISQKVSIDPLAVTRINLNTCTVDDLKKHPYISYNVARALVNYRTMHGNYRKTEDIRASDLVNDELYRKIVPYLTVE